MATVYFNSPQLACFFFGADGNGCTHQAGELSFCTCGKRSAMDALEVDFKNPAADDLWLKTACCCYHCGFNFGEGLCAIRRGSNCCWGCYQDAAIFSCFDKNTSRAACLKSAGNTKCYQCEFDETCLCTQDLTQLNLCWCLAVWKSKVYGAFVLNHRVVLHAIDARPARWRDDADSSPLDEARTAASSPRNDLVKNCRVHPTHWLISTQVPRARVEVGHACPRLLGVLHVRQGPGLLHVQQVRVSLQRRSAL